MSAPLALVACANHSDREAIGVCVKCRKRVCGECTTKVDGINHCVSCFEQLVEEHASDKPAEKVERPAAAFLWATVGIAIAALVAWGVLEIGLPGGG